ARNPRTSTETLQKLAQDENIWVQVSVAEHPQIPTNVLTAVLSTMAQNPEWRVRVEAAWNEHTPEEILQILAGDGVWFVRQAVASNGCAPAEALRLLARDHEADVRQRVAWNPQTPAEVLGTLARNPAWQVRAIVARHPRISEEILRLLAVDEEEGVRQVVAHNTSAPVEVLQNLARDHAVKVRKAVVENPQAPEDILHILALDPDGEVRRQVRLLQRIVTEVGEPLQEKSWWGKLNQLLEDGHALDWTENALIARQLYSVANLGVSAKLRRSILTALAIDWDFSMIRSAFDLEDSDGVMEFFGVIRESYEYVLAPFMSPVALKKLSLSPQWDVRYLVALHDRTPGEVRQRLSQDGNRYVRAMARARLAMLSESIPEE
ncbi:MAG TPA: hypothetical protein VFN35_03260, partial [Ktedonobacteraceae bacterium]|nr:hypothetical protein [Ktedonobacteraceae bacterium]